MQENQYEINRVIFNLDYEDKILASRCNNELERIFESEIIPEIEKAISSKIPKDINFTLGSLEIDISTINEKNISEELTKRIYVALEESLDKKMNIMNENVFHNNEDEILISNAGLVLFWPFLTQFFEQLELLKNEKFVNDECKNRAVYLLQYLTFGHIEFPEYVLTLNKLLVGIPLNQRLRPIYDLTEVEKELATSLNYGFINNWDKVKNATIKGVQETFFQRQGLLTNNDEHLNLHIEKKGQDVLIESIPWNFSTIKLPWMQTSIIVEWL